MAKPTKVMDVAKPGDGKADIGSKPMIVGHKAENDPMVKEQQSSAPVDEVKDEAPAENNNDSPDTQSPSATKKVIKPLSDISEQTSEPTAESKPDTKQPTEDKSLEDLETEKAIESIDDQIAADSNATDKNKTNDENNTVQELINSKKYFVTVNKDNRINWKVFGLTYIIFMILSLVTAAALIDADVLSIDIELPFDFL